MKADVLIVTVTKPESQAVLRIFHEATGSQATHEPIGDKLYLALGTINDSRVFLVHTERGTAELVASIQTVQKGIAALKPDALIMTGIAFGVDSTKQAI